MINNDIAEKLQVTLFTAGWRDVIKPALANRAQQALKALVLHPSERSGDSKNLSDDALRARISEIEYLLSAFENELTVWHMNRRQEELQRQNGSGLTPESIPAAANP